jgi:hypothetical protein
MPKSSRKLPVLCRDYVILFPKLGIDRMICIFYTIDTDIFNQYCKGITDGSINF